MKHLIIILLAFVTLSVQAQKKDRKIDNKITADSISTQIARVDTLKFNDGTSMSTAAGGSSIYASDGVYMDGDTVKWKKIQFATGDSVILLAHINNDSASYAGIEKDGVTLVSVSNTSSANVLIRNSYIGIINNSEGENSTNLQIDLTGVHYLEPPDTTLTTPLHLMTEAQTKREINAMQPTNNIFSWDAVNKWYAPYSSKQAFMSAYLGTDDPTIFTRLNIDATLHAFAFQGRQVVALSSVASSNALGLFGRTSNGPASHIYQSGNNELWAGMFTLKLERTNGGSGNLLNNILEINDSPTTSGTRSGKIMKVAVDGVDRISLNPRATGTTTPYIFQTHDKPEGNLFEFGMQGRNKVYADTSGHITFKGTYASIFRHKSLGDTTQSIPTGTTPTKVLAFSTNGEQSNCTADKTNDKIIITKPGRYMVNLSLSYASGTNAVNWTAYIFNGGVECENIHSTGYTSTANDKRSTSLSGIINVTSVPCDIDYRVSHSAGASVNLIMTYVNLNVNYIGE